ncbi:MAG: chemotaxis protein CheD [Desulfonatronovibrionaceae bacterium]
MNWSSHYPPHLEMIYLHIGDGGLFDYSCMIQTVLGSCVSVMLISHDPAAGGTFHAMLPDYRLHERAGSTYSVYKYVNSALDYLLERFRKKGIRPSALQAKVFGGADQIGMRGIGAGKANVDMAYRTLKEKRIRITAEDIGGKQGRKVLFFPHSGEVWIKKIANSLE